MNVNMTYKILSQYLKFTHLFFVILFVAALCNLDRFLKSYLTANLGYLVQTHPTTKHYNLITPPHQINK